MITKSFVKKVHCFFDELNYRATKLISLEDFETAALKTLTHCKDLGSAKNAILMYQFCLENWNKIERMFDKKFAIFSEYQYEGNALISLISDEEALGTYYITNGIHKRVTDVFVASSSFEDEMCAIDFKNNRFSIFEDGEYYMKYSRIKSSTMKLFNNRNECLCNIVLSDSNEIFLENNLTKYEIVIYDGFVGIYEREYIDKLKDDDNIDSEKMIASIDWDILKKNSKFGVAQLDIYSEDQDFEMLLFFATATFLVYQKFISNRQAVYAFLAFQGAKRGWN